jgi:NADH-quinone oxidoreductase subunit E
MSVRRLADAAVQPAAFAFNKANTGWAKAQIKKYPKGREQSAVIPLMMRAQEQEGWVTKAAIEHIADMLEMPRIRALEVATFYTQFQLKPVGTKAHVQVCGTTPCMLRGSEELMAVCRSKIHHDQFHVNASGTLSWEEVECLGACVNAPMVMIFNDTYEDLTPKRLEEIIDAFDAGKGAGVTPGPQISRTFSAPVSGLTSLNDNKAKAAKPAAKKDAEPVAKAQEKPVAPAALISAAKKAPASKTPSAASAKPAAEQKPELLEKPRTGKGDDLKLIWGVGPKLAKMLNEMGIWHFDQIASWGKAELAWADERLEGFKGRAARDEWVQQSKKLAKGWRPDNAVGEKPQ